MTDFETTSIDFMTSEVRQQASEDNFLSFEQEPCKPLLRKQGESPFKDSWEAEAYAMGNLLVKLRHLTAKQWMDLMSDSISEAQSFGDPDTGETYYMHWCRSLERYCFQAGLSNPKQYRETLNLWREAIRNTPHGVPLTIENAHLPIKHEEEHHGQHNHAPDCDTHGHSHARPANPPKTYYEPIARQVLKPCQV